MKLKQVNSLFLALVMAALALATLSVAAHAALASLDTEQAPDGSQSAAPAVTVQPQTAQPQTAQPVRIGYTLTQPEAEPEEETAPEPAAEAEPEPEPEAEPEPEPASAVPDDLELLDTFLATAYCQTGTTATGTYTTVNRTLAVNPGIIPYGTHVWLYLDDGTLVGDYYAEDTGSNMMAHPYVIDIYMGTDYDTCIEWGVQHVSVYVEKDAAN